MNAEDILKNQSCFDFLPTVESKSVSLVLIDPPYEISRSTNFASGPPCGRDIDRFRVSMDFGEWDHSFDGLDEVLKECYRALKNGGTIICFHDLWKIGWLKDLMEKAGFRKIRFIEWIKTNPVPLNSKFMYLTNAREAAVCGVKGGRQTFNSEYDIGLYRHPICHDKGRFHPTQKPLALIKELVEKHSNPGDTVMDCFSGSGTTCLAAIQLGRKFIGCELSEEYWKKSVDRINSEANMPNEKDAIAANSTLDLFC